RSVFIQTPATATYTLSLHDALPIWCRLESSVPRAVPLDGGLGEIEQVRSFPPHHLGEFVHVRIDQRPLSDEHRGNGLVATGHRTHACGGLGVLPNVDLPHRQAAFPQPATQDRAERATRTPIELDLVDSQDFSSLPDTVTMTGHGPFARPGETCDHVREACDQVFRRRGRRTLRREARRIRVTSEAIRGPS